MRYRVLTEEQIEMVMSYLYDNREPMMIINEDVMSKGDLLKLKRVHDGYNQSQLSRILRMSTGTLCEIERGIREIPKRRKKAVDDYIYKTLFLNGRLEYIKDGKTDENGEFILDYFQDKQDEPEDLPIKFELDSTQEGFRKIQLFPRGEQGYE